MIDHLNSMVVTTEMADISNNVGKAIEKAGLTDEFLSNITPQLKSRATEMVSGIGTKRGKDMTNDVDRADALRDSLLKALIMFLRAFVEWNKPTTADAANQILSTIKSHGNNIARANYEKESALLESLLGEFEKNELAAALETLNLTALVGELKEAQTQFNTLYLQSAAIESGKAGTIAPSSIRSDAKAIVNSIIDYLNLMNSSNNTKYGKLTTNIAELVNTLNGKIRSRHTHQKGAASKAATNPGN